MNNVHCSPGIKCPTDLNFLYEKGYVRRAGIIPYMVHHNITYILIGLSKEKNPVWADLGGRSEVGETTFQTAFREYGEESRHVLPIDTSTITKIFITNKDGSDKPDQVIIIVNVESSDHNLNINNPFQLTIPKTKYEDEMYSLHWIPFDSFLGMKGLSKSLKSIQKLLKSVKVSKV